MCGIRTVQSGFNGTLNRHFKDGSVFPDIDHASQLALDFGWRAFVGNGRGFRNHGGERDDEVFFVAYPGLLNDLCRRDMLAKNSAVQRVGDAHHLQGTQGSSAWCWMSPSAAASTAAPCGLHVS